MLFSICLLWCWQGEFFQQCRASLVGDILVTLTFDSGVMMLEEIRCWSPLGVKWLINLPWATHDTPAGPAWWCLNVWLGDEMPKEIMNKNQLDCLTLYTQTSVCIFSTMFSTHLLSSWFGKLFNNQGPLQFVIISSILLTLICDSGEIL